MRKKIAAGIVVILLLISISAQAQGVEEASAMLRAFSKTNAYAQGFEVGYRVTRSPGQAVPLLQKGEEAAKELPFGTFTTKEEKQSTQLSLTCRVAPEISAARDALSRMRRVLGAGGEVTLTLYGQSRGDAERTAEEELRILLDTLGDGVRSTRREGERVVLLGAAYQAATWEDEGRVRIAIARPRFEENS